MTAHRLEPLHMARAIQKATGPGPDPPLLGPDEMQLYSYYRPGLSAGTYEVSVVQEIDAAVPTAAKRQTLTVTNVRNVRDGNPDPKIETLVGDAEPQRFEVVVPRFTLDPELINSYYPPDGHQDEGRILPHIVLNDPHYPWEIDAGSTTNMAGPIDGPKNDRNMVPWIGLVVFDPDELRLDDKEIKALRIPGVTDVAQQNANGTFTMAVKDYFDDTKFIPKQSQIDIDKGYGDNKALKDRIRGTTDLAKVMFPTKELFADMFSDCESMKYLAHVRNINTVGFPNAGVEQLGLYSVVVSSRTGRFDITKPTTQVVHLVSIENFDSTVPGIQAWLGTDPATRKGPDRIGIFSLHSWVYTALPPDPINFVDTVENLVRKQQMLRADQPTLDAINEGIKNIADGKDETAKTSAKQKASQVLLDRLSAGYTFARWRCETGEETTALNRGPLVPVRQPAKPASDLPDCSNTSKEFQILDKDTGLMDLSYSTAWQLGKTLAIADTVFSAAMLRFRSALHNATAGTTRAMLNKMKPKDELLRSLSVSLQRANDLSCGTPGHPERLRCKCPAGPVTDVTEDEARPVFKRNMAAGVLSHSLAGTMPFTGLNKEPANDDDWVTIHNWMADKLFLADIPPHYLIPEASFVPPEAIRFFYVDDFWLDCLLDGALSVANHLDRDDDILRTEVKTRFNTYLQTPVPDTGIKPQIPSYGFILRSKIIETMPDLRITVKWTVPDPKGEVRHPVCRYTRFDKTTLICLLDRQPEELDSIELAQPPHQQRFSLGYNLYGERKDKDGVTNLPGRLIFKIRKLYTNGAPETGEWFMATKQPKMAPDTNLANADKIDQTRAWYNWDTRCIQLRTMMDDLTKLLDRNAGESYEKDGKTLIDTGEYHDPVPNSCALGIELNDPSYYFTIRPPKMEGKMVPKPKDGSEVKPPDKVIVPRDRQLYINTSAKKLAPPKPLVMRMAKRTILPAVAAATLPASETLTPSPPANVPPPGHAPHIQAKTVPFPSSAMALRNRPSSSSAPKSSLAGPSIPRPVAGIAAAAAAAAAAPSIPFTQLTSQFTLTLYADYKAFPKNPTRTRDGFDPLAYLPTKNVFLYDLIFSLRKNSNNLVSSYPLLEIQIDIPTDPVPPLPKIEPLIKGDYRGGGVKMLSNQRFVPLLYTDPEAGYLRVRVMPRTAEDSFRFVLSDAKSDELCFRLAEPEVVKVKNGQSISLVGGGGSTVWRGVSTITMVEIYAVGEDKGGLGAGGSSGGSDGVAGGKQTTWPVTSSIEVVKWDTRDAEDVKMQGDEDKEVGRT
ncbi:hypothetical protein QBC37DRAFT_466589 [Rhypophila decipiens]|uniref:Uncharacterized protein n=1 Tax=Rhypophila decipiens TaxID=261697 RepID=A0AAN6Y8J6_9PEZI|nr:hypothetical protein QBC37DRAFT_466589 [Rhypophila decipiens]